MKDDDKIDKCETIDELREHFLEREIKKGTDSNTALAIACSMADREMHGRAERGELAIEVGVVGPTTTIDRPVGYDLPSVDQLRSKYYEKEIKKGADHNAALGAACQKADKKIASLAEARLAARHAAPPPAEREPNPYGALLATAQAQGDDLELAAKRQELAILELKAEIRATIREEMDALRASMGQERSRGMSLLVGGGRR